MQCHNIGVVKFIQYPCWRCICPTQITITLPGSIIMNMLHLDAGSYLKGNWDKIKQSGVCLLKQSNITKLHI